MLLPPLRHARRWEFHCSSPILVGRTVAATLVGAVDDKHGTWSSSIRRRTRSPMSDVRQETRCVPAGHGAERQARAIDELPPSRERTLGGLGRDYPLAPVPVIARP